MFSIFKGETQEKIEEPKDEHAVILRISSDAEGYSYDVVKRLEEELEGLLPDDAELDGDEFSEDDALIYMYGPSADTIFNQIKDMLASSVMDVSVTLRYGSADNVQAPEKHYIL